jgi:hypothetical protein
MQLSASQSDQLCCSLQVKTVCTSCNWPVTRVLSSDRFYARWRRSDLLNVSSPGTALLLYVLVLYNMNIVSVCRVTYEEDSDRKHSVVGWCPLFVTVCRIWKEMSFVLLQFVLHEHSVQSKPKGSFQLHNLPPVAESFAGILFRVHVTWYWCHHTDTPMLFRPRWHTLTLWRHGVRPLSVWMLLVFSPSACSRIKCVLYLRKLIL